MNAETQSILDLARNIARNSRATHTGRARNKRMDSDAFLLQSVASSQTSESDKLTMICRRACRDCPAVNPARLVRFLAVADDPEWRTERVARHLARRMQEGMI